LVPARRLDPARLIHDRGLVVRDSAIGGQHVVGELLHLVEARSLREPGLL